MRRVTYETHLPGVWVEGFSSDGDGVQRVVVDMFENEGEEGSTEVYKPLGERQRSSPGSKPQRSTVCELGQDGGGLRK